MGRASVITGAGWGTGAVQGEAQNRDKLTQATVFSLMSVIKNSPIAAKCFVSLNTTIMNSNEKL